MSHPSTAREALIVEAIGDVARLIERVEAVGPVVEESCRALQLASMTLRDELAGFERRMAAITEHAKTQTVKHIAHARTRRRAGPSTSRAERWPTRRAWTSVSNSARRPSGCKRRCSR